MLKLQRPAKTSRTSSKLPSTDRMERREQFRPGGAKPGHEGHSRGGCLKQYFRRGNVTAHLECREFGYRLELGTEANYAQIMRHLLTSIVVLFVTPLAAQTTALKISPGKMIQIGYFSFLKNDCSGGAKPSFKLRSPVEHGHLIVKPATLSTKRLAQCGVVNAPTLVVVYKADATFTGSVSLNFDVINTETGQTQHVDAIVEVAPEHLKI